MAQEFTHSQRGQLLQTETLATRPISTHLLPIWRLMPTSLGLLWRAERVHRVRQGREPLSGWQSERTCKLMTPILRRGLA